MASRAERTQITADAVLTRMAAIAFADAKELSELRRVNCRYCYGADHLFQYTPQELQQARETFEKEIDKIGLDPITEADRKAEFTTKGGVGWNPWRDPHPECPECFGKGVEEVYFKDTRDANPAAQMLFAGVKRTEKGLEVKTHDQQTALLNVGRHLGMFAQKVKHSNDPDNPMPPASCGFAMIPPKEEPDGGPGG